MATRAGAKRLDDGGRRVEQSIEQAPEWVRELMAPAEDIAAMREDVRRYLAGDTTAPVGPLSELEALLDRLDAAEGYGATAV
jgi:hypothetical protein